MIGIADLAAPPRSNNGRPFRQGPTGASTDSVEGSQAPKIAVRLWATVDVKERQFNAAFVISVARVEFVENQPTDDGFGVRHTMEEGWEAQRRFVVAIREAAGTDENFIGVKVQVEVEGFLDLILSVPNGDLTEEGMFWVLVHILAPRTRVDVSSPAKPTRA
jgi:hypothetical protein